MTRALRLCRQAYYKWHRGAERRAVRIEHRQEKLHVIKVLFLRHRRRYGSPRIQQDLLRSGVRYSLNSIAAIMRTNELYATPKRRFRPTTDSSRTTQPAPNILAQHFNPVGTNKVWVSDFTELPCKTSKVYMAGIMDLGSRRILGFCVHHRMWTQTLLTVFFRAMEIRGFSTNASPKNPIIFHSDQGSQYDSDIFTSTLLAYNFRLSMSRKANCYDNAPMESFWSRMKAELYEHFPFRNVEHAAAIVNEYIHQYYNNVRLHSSIGFRPPIEFEYHNNSLVSL